MHNFKVGDEAWFFTFPEDGCGGFDISQIELQVTRDLKQADIDYVGYLAYAYPTKQSAIDAIILKIFEIFMEKENGR